MSTCWNQEPLGPPGSMPTRVISSAIHWAAAPPFTVPAPRPSYLSSASSLSRAARSAAVISGEVVSLAPTGPAGAAGAAGSGALASSFGPHPASATNIRLAADSVSNLIHISLKARAHYPRRGNRQGLAFA